MRILILVLLLVLSVGSATAKEYTFTSESCPEEREDGTKLEPGDIKEIRLLDVDNRAEPLWVAPKLPFTVDIDGSHSVIVVAVDKFGTVSDDSNAVTVSESPPKGCVLVVDVGAQ